MSVSLHCGDCREILTTLDRGKVAAVQLGFNFIGVEIDPAHFATARRRIREAEPLAPLLTGTD